MKKGSPEQVTPPRIYRKWPTVANRHRKTAMEEAQEILDLITKDFIELLQDDIGDDLIDALTCVRRNPTKAIKHIQMAQRSLKTIARSMELVNKRAEIILTVLENAPADDVEEAA